MVSSKLDRSLAVRVHNLSSLAAADAELSRTARVRVLVHVVGDLRTVERAGLWTELVAGPVAIGTIAVGDLDQVAELDDVASIESGRRNYLHIHDSEPEIRADKARQIPPGFTGRNVIVGVVDSGVDIFHQAFRKSDGTTPSSPTRR